MADVNVKQPGFRPQYVPGCTLGRSGYQVSKEDQMGACIAQLHALLCVVNSGEEGFESFNQTIQRTVLELAEDLAEEVHELHAALLVERVSSGSAA